MFNQGVATRVMSETLGCSHKLMKQELKKLGLMRTFKQIKYISQTNRQIDTIKELYFSGVSGKEIAKQLHIHPATIYRTIKRLNLIKNEGWQDCQLNADKLFQMKESGMSFRQIGEYFSVPTATVFYQFKKLQNNIPKK